MTTWLAGRYRHGLIGLVLLVLPVFYFWYSEVSLNPLNPHDHLIQNGLTYLFFVTFSYVNHTLFVPRWYLTRHYERYFVVAIGCVLVMAYLPHRIEQWTYFKPPQQSTVSAWAHQIFVAEMMLNRPRGEHSPDHPGVHRKRPPSGPFDGSSPQTGPPENLQERPLPTFTLSAKLLIFLLLGSVSTLISVSVQTASRLRQIENDHLVAELRQLRAQIQPHFLFNTLNSIYALALRKDDATADTVVKLSEFMRYTIREAHYDTVPLAHEIGYIGNYIDLQKARLRDAVQIDYQLAGPVHTGLIAPLLLFSFIENAFKYGVNPEEPSPIRIHIAVEDGQLTLDVFNNKVQVSRLQPSTGIGLQNARQRLQLLYPGEHSLRINETAAHYQVTLQLTLT